MLSSQVQLLTGGRTSLHALCTISTGASVKKVRVSLNPGSSGRKIYLFSSAESLYVWLTGLENDEHLVVPDLDELLLEPGGFIEVELLGYEYAYEDGSHFHRLNFVRLGKAMPSKNAGGLVVTFHSGWVTTGLLPMKRYSDVDIDVMPLAEGESKIDLDARASDEPSNINDL